MRGPDGDIGLLLATILQIISNNWRVLAAELIKFVGTVALGFNLAWKTVTLSPLKVGFTRIFSFIVLFGGLHEMSALVTSNRTEKMVTAIAKTMNELAALAVQYGRLSSQCGISSSITLSMLSKTAERIEEKAKNVNY